MIDLNDIDLSRFDHVALDTETTGLNWPVDEMFGFSITTPVGSGYWDIRVTPAALDWLRDNVARYRGVLIFHNATFDLKMLHSAGVRINPTLADDTGIRACLIDEHLSTPFPWRRGHDPHAYSLDSLAARYLGRKKDSDIYEELARIFGGPPTRRVQAPRFKDAPLEVMRKYAIIDTELTYELWEWQQPKIMEPDNSGMSLQQVYEFERSIIPEVLQQEMNGIRVDVDAAAQAQMQLHAKTDKDKRRLSQLVGRDFNVNSTPQIRDHYKPRKVDDHTWELANGHFCNITPKGNPSINAEVLKSLAKQGDEVATMITKIRSQIRTADTFLGKHVIGHAHGGRVYPKINQVVSDDGGTKTGRFSYVDPALQQIPNRDQEVAAIVKPVFLPDEGDVWLDGDMASFEVRTFAHLVARFNAALVEIYKQDPYTDFHQWVADLMGVPRNPQPEGGANAKQLNLSMIFNSGKGAIAKQLGLPATPDVFSDQYGKRIKFYRAGVEAESVISKYHARVQGVNHLVEGCKDVVARRGYLFTMFGRKLRFPRQYKAYKASGILIQATAADVNKDNWRIIGSVLGDRGRMLLNTHDSYSISVREDKKEEVWKDVKAAIERPILRVPLILDLNGSGDNWWEAVRKDK
jgi:DNA polymerase I-like protein with 3'-5' exonuclease and polymerase domains